MSVLKAALEEGLDRLQQQTELRLHQHRSLHQLLDESIQLVNSTILQAARAESKYNGMGTTLVVALFHHGKIIVAHLGDSRAYRFRQGELVQKHVIFAIAGTDKYRPGKSGIRAFCSQ